MTTTRRAHKRSVLAGAALTLILGATATACAPTPPPDSVGIRCEPHTNQVAATPSITFDTKPVELRSTSRSTPAACDDSTGQGITSVRFKDLSLTFPATSCLPEPGTAGSGTVTAMWSDGSTSRISIDAAHTDTFSGTLKFTVLDGAFEQFEGTGEFLASPTAGNCSEGGVTRADVTTTRLSLMPPTTR
jgi:hypothetical protein